MESSLVEELLKMTLLGTEWVLWLLLAASVLSLAIMFERVVFFISHKINVSSFNEQLTIFLKDQKWDEAETFCAKYSGLEAQTALNGIRNRVAGKAAMEGSMEGFIVGQRQKLDRGLVVLGTLGNNAPFIGLFGTVLGIIQAFHDLAQNPDGGPAVVMAGISEALVATAVGLLVAIPAVIAFNAFNRVVKRKIANAQALVKVMMTYQSGQK